MERTMTPSGTPITSGQIGEIQDMLAVGLRQSGLLSEPVQTVLESQGSEVVREFIAAFRRRVEAIYKTIVRHVRVNRDLTPQQLLDATTRVQYVDQNVVVAMPKGDTDEGDIYFVQLDLSKRGGHISDEGLDRELDSHDLKPCDPYKLAQANIDDPAFADDHPNAAYWKDASGEWCYVAFNRWYAERRVIVHRRPRGWNGRWWFAGLRK